MTLDQCIEEVKKLERTDLNKAILAYLQELKIRNMWERARQETRKAGNANE